MLFKTMAFALLFSLSYASASDVFYPELYKVAITNSLKFLQSQGMLYRSFSIVNHPVKAGTTTVAIVTLDVAPKGHLVIQVPMDINGTPFTNEAFEKLLTDKMMHAVDTALTMPEGAKVSAGMVLEAILNELVTLEKDLKAGLKPGGPGFKPGAVAKALGPFHLTYIRSLLGALGKVEFRIGRKREIIEFDQMKFDRDTTSFLKLKENLSDSLKLMAQGLVQTEDFKTKMQLLEELIKFVDFHQVTIVEPVGEEAETQNNQKVEKLLRKVSAAVTEFKFLKEYYQSSSAAHYSEHGRMVFREKLERAYTRVVLLESLGVRLKCTLVPVEIGSKLQTAELEMLKLDPAKINAGLKADITERHATLISSIELERIKLHSQIVAAQFLAMQGLETEEQRNGIKFLEDQLKTLEFQYKRAMELSASSKALKVRR